MVLVLFILIKEILSIDINYVIVFYNMLIIFCVLTL